MSSELQQINIACPLSIHLPRQALLRASDPQHGDIDRAMWIYEQLNDTIIQTALLLEGRSGQQVRICLIQ